MELIGAGLETIKLAEDRELFRNAMREIGLNVPAGGCVRLQPQPMVLSDYLPMIDSNLREPFVTHDVPFTVDLAPEVRVVGDRA